MKTHGFIMPVRVQIHHLIIEGNIVDEEWVSGNEIAPVVERFNQEVMDASRAGICASHEVTFLGYWCNALRGSA